MTFFRWIKHIGALKIAVALFSALALFILIVDKPGSTSREKIEASQPLLFPRLFLEEITNVVVTEPGHPDLTFRKAEAGWQKDEEAFLNAIINLKAAAIVSRNPGKQSLFGLDPAHAAHIRLWKNTKTLADFYVGESTELKSQFVRLEGSDEVFDSTPLLPPFSP